MIEFKMPSLGADMEDGLLVEWKKNVGDSVSRGDIIAEVETQKGDMEIECFDEGIIDQILVQPGTRVPVGTVLAMLRPKDQTTSPTVSPAPAAADVEVQRTPPSQESIVNVRQAVAAAMSRSNREIPHYYLVKTIDMSKALAWLAEQNAARSVQKRLLPVTMFIKAVAKALVDVPQLNATWTDDIQLKSEINIGFVVSLRGGGIMVPSINNANTKSIDEIMDVLNDLIPRAREMRLRSSEVGTSTITVTSLGEGGADEVFGIIYPPQVAVVGFGAINDHSIVHVSLGGDHRATDGLTGSKFLMSLNDHLQHPEAL